MRAKAEIAHLDAIDRSILTVLQREGKLTNLELADRVHLSPSACLRRVRILEESGIIAGYAALVDPRSLGLGGTAFIAVTLDRLGRAETERFERAVASHPEILECFLIAGTADYMLRIVYRDASDLERIHTEILSQLPGVVRTTTTLTLRTVKQTTALPLP